MDKLALRRALYQAPAEVDPNLLLGDSTLQQLQHDLLKQDELLRNSLRIDVPANLAEQILLQQSKPKRTHWRWLSALAASIALVALLPWSDVTPTADLSSHALRHVYHELAALRSNAEVNNSQVASLLQDAGLQGRIDIPVRYARHCDIDGVRSLHLVVEFNGQPMTIFILTDQPVSIESANTQFADARFIGEQIQWRQKTLLVVAEQSQSLDAFHQLLRLNQFITV